MVDPLLSAQKDKMGIPEEFVQQRMEEIEKQKVLACSSCDG